MSNLAETPKGKLAYSVLLWVDEAQRLMDDLRSEHPNLEVPELDLDGFYELYVKTLGEGDIEAAIEAHAKVARSFEDYCATVMLSQLR